MSQRARQAENASVGDRKRRSLDMQDQTCLSTCQEKQVGRRVQAEPLPISTRTFREFALIGLAASLLAIVTPIWIDIFQRPPDPSLPLGERISFEQVTSTDQTATVTISKLVTVSDGTAALSACDAGTGNEIVQKHFGFGRLAGIIQQQFPIGNSQRLLLILTVSVAGEVASQKDIWNLQGGTWRRATAAELTDKNCS